MLPHEAGITPFYGLSRTTLLLEAHMYGTNVLWIITFSTGSNCTKAFWFEQAFVSMINGHVADTDAETWGL